MSEKCGARNAERGVASREDAEGRKVKFGDIAINSVAKKKPTAEDAVHYIGLEHIDPGSFVVSRWGGDVAPVGDKLLMKKGDVLFGRRRAYQRKVAIAPFDGIFSAHGMVLRPKIDVIDEKFFPFFIASDQFMDMAVKISVGGLSPTINWKTLKECEFNLPPLARQRELANLLWAANDLKESYKKAITATDEMLKAKFREMFGEVRNSECGIRNGNGGVASRGDAEERSEFDFSAKEIGLSKWVSIGEVADVFSGGTPCRNKPEYWDGGTIPWVKTTELQNTYIHETEEKITAMGVKNSSAKLMPENTILVAMYGQGKTRGMTGCLSIPATTNQACACIVARDCVDVRYLWMFLILSYHDLRRLANSTSQANLSLDIIKRFQIPLPPLSLQREFVAIAERADATKSALKQSIADIEQVMKGLING